MSLKTLLAATAVYKAFRPGGREVRPLEGVSLTVRELVREPLDVAREGNRPPREAADGRDR